MRIGIIVNTPDQVYFYKNICKVLEREGDDCFFVARDYGETINPLGTIRHRSLYIFYLFTFKSW